MLELEVINRNWDSKISKFPFWNTFFRVWAANVSLRARSWSKRSRTLCGGRWETNTKSRWKSSLEDGKSVSISTATTLSNFMKILTTHCTKKNDCKNDTHFHIFQILFSSSIYKLLAQSWIMNYRCKAMVICDNLTKKSVWYLYLCSCGGLFPHAITDALSNFRN